MNYKCLTDDEVVPTAVKIIGEERFKTTEVINIFEEISSRKLFLKFGYPSLYEMAIHHFGYCAGSAMRRINAMKLIREIPEVEAKIQSGDLSLTVAADVQTFFYQEAKNKRAYSRSAKIELLDKSVGMSKRDLERELASRNPMRDMRDTSYALSNDRLRVSFSISHELDQKLKHLKDLLGHVDENMSTEALIDRLADLGIEKYDPNKKAERAQTRSAKKVENAAADNFGRSRETSRATDSGSALIAAQDKDSPPPAEVNLGAIAVCDSTSEKRDESRSRYIEANERHQVVNDGLGCTYVNSRTGKRCGSTRFLQLDHIHEFAKGGSSKAENLRWMCGAHNRWRSETERQH